MRRPSAWILAAASLGLLTACPPTYPNCKSDEHCKDQNEVCVQGQCRECAGDENCKPGFRCENNRCVPKGGCTSDTDCGAGQRCQNGQCVSSAQNSCLRNEDCGEGQECQGGTCVTKAVATCTFEAVRFDFNKANLSEDAKQSLSDLADCIKRSGGKVVLEGHADERGTEEFNMQLSNRRAESVKAYLSALGVNERTLDTVGFGENKPAVDGHDESAWSANRRVEFRR